MAVQLEIVSKSSVRYVTVCGFAYAQYKARFGIELETYPDVFVVATIDEVIVGCFGATYGHSTACLTTEAYLQDQHKRSLCKKRVWNHNRSLITEIGTRVVCLPEHSSVNSVTLSLALSTALLLYIATQNARYVLSLIHI